MLHYRSVLAKRSGEENAVRRSLAAIVVVIGLVSSASAREPEKPLAITVADRSLRWGACPPVFPPGCKIAVLHGDPAQPNADIFLQLPSGYVLPPHSHTSAERMTLVTGRLRVKYQGHAEAILNVGNYAFGPAGLPHRGECLSGEPCTLFIAFEGPVDAKSATVN